MDPKKDKVVNLSEWFNQHRLSLCKVVMDCLSIPIQEICMCISEYTLDEEVLIPNTAEPGVFHKYWHIVRSGPSDADKFKYDHRVDVKLLSAQPRKQVEIELTRRAAIASINEYIPSKNAKLKIECA